MTLISIREYPAGADGSNARLSFDSGEEYPITIRDPFVEADEQRLEWYFEEYLSFPFIKQVEASTAAASITSYGEGLFKQVFADPEAFVRYKTGIQEGLNTLQLEIAGSPEFHRLHWEALKDPKLPQPLALSATMVRKNIVPQVLRASMRTSPTVNLLIVTARPFGAKDVGYRTISRPLVELLNQAEVPVQIDILRPGTYEALDSHLREMTTQKGAGYYHVIHFDVHGALLPYDYFQKPEVANRYLFQGRYGRTDIASYEGVKAFLFLEGKQDDQADPVEAGELANLLLTHQVPIAILNACQSGKQVGVRETSLGSRLLQAGVQMVLAMGYSLRVSAAEILIRTLYGEIFEGRDISQAIRAARQELYNRKGRRAYFNSIFTLEDWILPVVYQNQAQSLRVRDFTPEESTAYYSELADRYKPSHQPGYGFVGRDLDILQLEKRLLTRRNIVLVRGMGGAGKTTLLHHLGQWWQSTGLVEQVFYFGYDEKAWTRQQLLDALARKLLSPVQYVGTFQPLNLEAQQAFLSKRLRAQRHLLILDNLESITGTQLAIQHTLPEQEQQELQHLLQDLAGGRTLVLLGSRSGEAWLAKGTFEDNVYELGGLDPEAASLLADRILERYKVTKYRQDPDLRQLLKLLDGFPLALEVVLANLAQQSPKQVFEALEAGAVTLVTGASQERTENILRCIDYSHGNLSPDAQQLLLCLAPFTSVLYPDKLAQYTDYLKEQSALAKLPFERWTAVVQETINWGLLSPDPNAPNFLRLQPTLPYFLRNRLNAPEQAEVKAAVEAAFRDYYNEIGNELYKLLDSTDPEQRHIGQVVTSLEYENLAMALNLALDAFVTMLNPYNALSDYLYAIKNHRDGLELSQKVLERLNSYPTEKLAGPMSYEQVVVMDDIAHRQFYLKQYEEAEATYRNALAVLLKSTSFDAQTIKTRSATFYHQLGYVAQEQRQWDKAEQYYQQALQIEIEAKDLFREAKTYQQLGSLATDREQWEQAEQNYQKALQIFIDTDNRYEQARIYHGLALVAEYQLQWDKAEKYYMQALQIYIDYNDTYEQAGIYYQLGVTAGEQRLWPQAEQYYQEALRIYINYDDRYSQAGTYINLGYIARGQQQPDQAEQYYRLALQIYLEYNDRYKQAGTYNRLGGLAFEKQDWSEARKDFLQSLKLFVESKDDDSMGNVLYRLAWLWQASGDKELPAVIAPIVSATTEEVENLFNETVQEKPTA